MHAASPAFDAAIDSARAEVERRRKTGGYPDELLTGLEAGIDLSGYTAAPEAVAHVPSARPLLHSGPLSGAIVLVKRVMRRALSWYVHPITEDVSRFNAAITAELRSLERRVAHLEAESERRQRRNRDKS